MREVQTEGDSMGPWNGNPKYDLSHVAVACQKGDVTTLETLLFTGDAENKFPGDINAHHESLTPLMLGAKEGQIEAVELMLKAKADPHMKARVPYGKDPADGATARELADKMGWDDIVILLEKAEKDTPPGKYKRYGKDQNARLPIILSGESGTGKDPFEGFKRTEIPQLTQTAHAHVDAEPERPAPPPRVKEYVPPPTTIVLMFPGQGSQYVKMMDGLKELPKVKEMAATAERVLGYDLLQVCLEGPEDRLEDTSVCQPAMFMAGLAGIEKLKETRPEAVERPGAVAGLSLGEYTALCAAGVFSFEDGLQLVKVRGAAMSEAARSRPQAMLSVAGLDQGTLEKLCKECAVAGEVCRVANVLFPKGYSCAGTAFAISKLKEAAEKAGAMQVKVLKTSGGFHTELMAPAQVKLEEVLKEILPRMSPPRCDVYMNVTGQKLKAGTDPSVIVSLLSRQLCSSVLWEPSVRTMIKDGLTEFYEVGPMKQLKAMMKRIDNNTWTNTYNVDV